MIGVQQALEKIRSQVNRLKVVELNIDEAIGAVLAEDVISPIDMPPFDQSAMDGYAINGAEMESFRLIGEIQAGDSGEGIELKRGEAVRIFTGAVVPKSATSVVKQEIVERDNDQIRIVESIKENQNIRPRGEQIKTNALALQKNTELSAGVIGYLYTLGLEKVKVYRKPKVLILVTGNELEKPGVPLSPGKIYESNSYTLRAAFKKMGIEANIIAVKDDYESTKGAISEALNKNDLLITTGGISVGDYDFVGKAMNEIGVESIFYKVKQKPGKPLFFGDFNNTIVFGLPGNPAAALSCFYIYVIPAIRKMMGRTDLAMEKRELVLRGEYKKTKNLSHFLKAKAEGDEVTILQGQSSAMLSAYAETNCLVHMPENREEWFDGDRVNAFILP